MKSHFITLRMDRMKNMNIAALYNSLCSDAREATTTPELLKAFDRLELQKSKASVLFPKIRKLPYTAEITKLRTANDKLAAAMLFHLKAVYAAGFDEDKIALNSLYKPLNKELKGYKRKSIQQKEMIDHNLFIWIENEDIVRNLSNLGLLRYIVKMKENVDRKNELLDKQNGIRALFPAPKTTTPAKEQLIAEIRFFLQTIDMHLHINSELKEEKLIKYINSFLKEARMQLRNTTTRRIRRKERLAQLAAENTQEKV